MVTIPELVGKKTKKKTSRGRDVYKTLRQIGPVPKGSSVSELGVSIPLNKKKTRWLNAPSIYHGVRYTDDEIKRFYKQGQLKPSEVEIIEGSGEDAAKASQKRSDKLRIKRATGGPPKPRSTDLSKILKGISRVARDPRLTALEAVRYAFGVSPTQGTHDEELARSRIGSEALDQPESGLSSIPLPDLYHQHMYTGGPHKWEGDTFDLEKVGTGEGHHMEGWGAYGGEVEDTGDTYRVNLTRPAEFSSLTFSEPRENIIGDSPTHKASPDTISESKNTLLDLEKIIGKKWKGGLFGPYSQKIEDTKPEQIQEAIDEIISLKEASFQRGWWKTPHWKGARRDQEVGWIERETNKRRNEIKFLRDIRGKVTGVEPEQRGTLYRTSLPKHIVDERFLDSDLPISEQSPYVQKALKTIVEERDDKNLSEWFASAMSHRPNDPDPSLRPKMQWLGKSFYRELMDTFTNPVIRFIEGSPRYRGRTAGTKRQASEALRDVGIPGLKYFDALSRPEQKGTRNFVVWDQELLDAAPVLRLKATGGVVSKGGSTTVRNPYGYSPKAI